MSSRLNTELLSGILFMLIGSVFLIGSAYLPFGTLRKIGPAGFPAMVAIALLIVGALIAIKAVRSAAAGEVLQLHPSKLGVIIASILVFGITVRGAGLLVAVALCSLIASFASRPFRPVVMGLYGLFLGASCSVVFITALGMPASIIGPWFGF